MIVDKKTKQEIKVRRLHNKILASLGHLGTTMTTQEQYNKIAAAVEELRDYSLTLIKQEQ
jgi:hypothetical protein